ncbi:MAG: prepilin-type N-terminal cleavage/methylation domain-containing protein [Oscillospiraceae bacterium]|nr:prepilin-type N-terminal cleavage/methylation domain-containing protein [Oscillospiraceae bacterium]
MNSKMFGSKVKGFTLIEMLIVIAIIGIIAGMASILIQGFQRDSRLETDNNKAQMLHTGFQNMVIKCEIKQDRELFDVDAHKVDASGEPDPSYADKDMIYAQVHFSMKDGKIGDTINVISTYKDVPNSLSQAIMRNNSVTKKWYAELEKEILSNMDATFEGGMSVFIDYENYTVDSAIYVENQFFNVDLSDADSITAFYESLKTYVQNKYVSNANKSFRILISNNKQKECVKYTGIYLGAYPTIMELGYSTS